MNWEAISAVADSVGAIGVVFSLLYLGVQIRDQNKESQLDSVSESTRQWNDVLASTASDPALCAVWVRGINDFTGLGLEERTQFTAHAGRILRVIEGMYEHYQKGRLKSEAWDAMSHVASDLFAYPGTRDWWETRRNWYSKSFQNYVDDVIRTTIKKANIYGENSENSAQINN